MGATQTFSDRATGVLKSSFYRCVRNISRLIGVMVFDLRCLGRENLDFEGAAIVLSTHQSHFDPVLIGLSFNGRMDYLARRTLFNNRILGAVIYLLNAIELDRDRSGIAGLKEMLKRLKNGHKVLMFPEGTRSSDGQIAPLKPGFLAVARRSRVPLVPVAITGAFEALPRTAKFPRRYPIHVAFGQPIEPEVVAGMTDEDLLELIRDRLVACYNEANAVRN
jgi:1-acyl-sn-glycerol-3-phosphate acyltransferase